MTTIVLIVFLACIFFGWYFYQKARNKERMSLIEKDADLSDIFKPRKMNLRFPWFRIGMIITGIGIGLITAIILSSFCKVKDELVFSLMMVFGGISIIIAHYLDKPENE